MIRISAVSYLNTKPFIYGLYKSPIGEKVELSLDIPALCAEKLRNQQADLVLSPVAIIPMLPEAHLVSEFCIGSVQSVKTVCIYSEVPLQEIKQIFLDFHSRTSVQLVQVLCRNYWQVFPEFLPASEHYLSQIRGETAGLVIGDRTIGLDQRFSFVYDLGEAWTAWTGLPFVYAAWVSTKPLEPEFVRAFNEALQLGLDHLPELIKILPSYPNFDLNDYFRNNISYQLDDAKWSGLNRFLGILAGESGYKLHRNVAAPTF